MRQNKARKNTDNEYDDYQREKQEQKNKEQD